MPGQTASQTKVQEWSRAVQPAYTLSAKKNGLKAQHMSTRITTPTPPTHTHTHTLMRPTGPSLTVRELG